MSGVTYLRENGQIVRADLDPADRAFYQEHALVRVFKDAFGAPDAASRVIYLHSEPLYSSNSSSWPLFLDQSLLTDGRNGCWIPDPPDSTPESLGARFDAPVNVTAFQFASGVYEDADCPDGVKPCSYPSEFVLEASNDGESWTTLLFKEDYHDMDIARSSPFTEDYPGDFDGRIFLSGRMEIPEPGWFLFYRMRVLDFMPNARGGYNVSELIFYGLS